MASKSAFAVSRGSMKPAAGRLTMYRMRSGSRTGRGVVSSATSNCRRTDNRCARLPASSAISSHGNRSSDGSRVATVSRRDS